MFISDNNTLLKFVPNTFTSVEGEEDLFDKVQYDLQMAEDWLAHNVVGDEPLSAIAQEDGTLNSLCASAIVAEAMRRAIPKLDLVLTPNGFGIVSNNNVAPASKERVERLIATLKLNRDHCIGQMLEKLPSREDWQNTAQCKLFGSTLFPNFHLCTAMGIEEDVFSRYLALRYDVINIEESIADEWVSPELLADLHTQNHLHNDSMSVEYRHVVMLLKIQILNALRQMPMNCRGLSSIVQYIRTRKEAFPLWHSSATAKLFDPPVFENEKKSGAYFF